MTENKKSLLFFIISILLSLIPIPLIAGGWTEKNNQNKAQLSSNGINVSYKTIRDQANNLYTNAKYNKSIALYYKLYNSESIEDKHHSLVMLSRIYKAKGENQKSVNFLNKSKMLLNTQMEKEIQDTGRDIFKVQVFFSESQDKATSAMYKLIDKGYVNAFIKTEKAKEGTLFYHVYSGKYPTNKRAKMVRRRLSKSFKQHYGEPFVVKPNSVFH